jgi:anaerobic dimethyl sulfoxide reductase subunit B (iron-sulfur subunit)
MLAHGFYFDQTRCTNCFTCVVACKDWNNVPAGPASWMKVKTLEEGRYPNLQVSFLVQCCYHCAKPRCGEVCPVQAIQKREDNGIVVIDQEVCLGGESCGICSKECPYGAPQFGAEENAKMQKCDLCFERLLQGLKPICVAACPMRALDAGPMDDLMSSYQGDREAEGFVFSSELKPSIIFKSKATSIPISAPTSL